MKRNFLFLAVALLALSGNIFADISETFTYTTPDTAVGFTDPFTLGSFDTNLGTLQSITIGLVTTGTVNVQIVNVGASPGSFTDANASFPFIVTGPDGTTVTTTTADGPVSGTVPGGFGFTTFPGVSSTASATETVNAGNFSLFETDGAGVLNFSAASGVVGSFGTYSGTTADPSVFFGGTGDISGVTSVTYTYEASTVTPEPALLGVISLCLGGVVLFRRKSLKKS